MRNNKKFHGGGVLLLALILALNMLLPMEVMAAPEIPSDKLISIDGANYGLNECEGKSWATWVKSSYNALGLQVTSDGYITNSNGTLFVCPEGSTTTSDYCKSTDIINNGDSFILAAFLDFTVTESLAMKVTQGHSDLAIDPCVITNNGSEDLKLSKVEINAASGWSVVNASTDFTTADSKNKIAFTAGSHDFADGAYAPGETIAAGSSTTLQLAGKISEKADLTNATQVASMVVTIEKPVEMISFTIVGFSYQAEKGMTWGEWVESSYNTASCRITGDIYIYYALGDLPGWICKGLTSNRVLVTDEIIAGTNYLIERSPHSGGSN